MERAHSTLQSRIYADPPGRADPARKSLGSSVQGYLDSVHDTRCMFHEFAEYREWLAPDGVSVSEGHVEVDTKLMAEPRIVVSPRAALFTRKTSTPSRSGNSGSAWRRSIDMGGGPGEVSEELGNGRGVIVMAVRMLATPDTSSRRCLSTMSSRCSFHRRSSPPFHG